MLTKYARENNTESVGLFIPFLNAYQLVFLRFENVLKHNLNAISHLKTNELSLRVLPTNDTFINSIIRAEAGRIYQLNPHRFQ